MPSLIHHVNLLATASACLLLGACISNPLPSGTVAALYQWDDHDTPAITRQGMVDTSKGRVLDGDFFLSGLPTEHPELPRSGENPWLLESCDEKQCYSIVLFAKDFGLNAAGLFTGFASMSALTTLMANEVRGLPADKVGAALDVLSVKLTSGALADYASLIRLDLRRAPKTREKLRYPRLYIDAVELHNAQPTATVKTLLGEEVQSTADLAVSQDFVFDSSWQLTVDVDLSSRSDAGAYLLLCSQFETADDGYKVDYSSCSLRAPLQAGTWQGKVKLTGIAAELIAVIMPLKNPDDTEYTVWQRAVDGETLKLR